MKRAFIATVLLFVTSLTVGCQSKMGGGCANGQCGVLGGGGCADCGPGDASCADGTCDLSAAGQSGGPLGGLGGYHHRGPQAHLGSMPGPAEGPSMPTYGYPYYTTRGPRDFLNPNPPSIGR